MYFYQIKGHTFYNAIRLYLLGIGSGRRTTTFISGNLCIFDMRGLLHPQSIGLFCYFKITESRQVVVKKSKQNSM